jgi:diaminopropionate ammonia-lyase
MSGLNCGTPSTPAWPFIDNGLDAATAVNGSEVIAAAHTLAKHGVDAGPCGAATLAALEHILTGPTTASRRRHLDVGPESIVVLLVTEGSESNPLPSA